MSQNDHEFAIKSIIVISLLFILELGRFHSSEIQFTLEGDILIGGLFPVHENEKSGNLHCGKSIQFARGIQRVEAMKYAIEKLNERPLGPYMKSGMIYVTT